MFANGRRRESLRGSVSLVVSMCAVLFAVPAHAIVRQPDGTMVPVGGSLQSYFTMRGEAINAINDAAVEPQRFVPGCTIRFTVIIRDTSYANAFGWYNVTPGRAPMAAELYELVSPTAPVGFTATLNVRMDARYRGGDIGFWLRTPPGYVYYTERDYQPDRVMTGGFVHVLMYDSRVTRNAFYFGWEDLFGGGDNDFQDLLMLVDNLVCAGGGMPCDTGERGACAAGTRQCRSGALTCVRTVGPTPERCDGVDNDCNNMIDDGMNLCMTGFVCDRGRCVPRCVEGSCFEGNTCSPQGTCIETTCLTVTCPSGERCVGGRCVGQCTGITCPFAQVCRAGRCVDPCEGVMCDPEQVCTGGICNPRCPCRGCAATESCRMSDGRCVETACLMMTCPVGSHCAAGACVDSCIGVTCPTGQGCMLGRCADLPPDAGVPGDGGGDASSSPDGGTMDGGVGPADSGLPVTDGASDARRRTDTGGGATDGGCGCRAAGANTPGLRAGFFAMVAVGLASRCRRRGRRRVSHREDFRPASAR